MKTMLSIVTIILLTSLMLGCGSESASAPSLSGNYRPTAKVPSPGNYGATNLMQGSTMTLPR
jgi:hypothetical protein